MGRPTQKAKAFFKTKSTSEYGVELMRMFILPFLKRWDPRASIDDAVGAFFNVDNRQIVTARALRNFKMPGNVRVTSGKYMKRVNDREVEKGTKFLMVVDRVDQIASVQLDIDGKEVMFRLRKHELEYLKDRVEIIA